MVNLMAAAHAGLAALESYLEKVGLGTSVWALPGLQT